MCEYLLMFWTLTKYFMHIVVHNEFCIICEVREVLQYFADNTVNHLYTINY